MTERQLLPATLSYALKLAEIAAKTGSVSAQNRAKKISGFADSMDEKLGALKDAVSTAHGKDTLETATNYRRNVVSAMEAARAVIDETEAAMPACEWPVPVYSDLLFRV
jgi:glutamine synthetase